MRVGIDVVQPHPGAEFAQRRGEVGEAGGDVAAAPFAGRVFQVQPVGAGILADHQQLLHPGRDEALRLAQHVARRAAVQPAAQRRNDAEGAGIVAALGNLQEGVMARRQMQPFRRHQVEERVMRRRHRPMHRADHRLVLVRAGDRQHVRMGGADTRLVDAHAAGDDDAAVARHGLADRLEALGPRAVEEAAGVDDDDVGALEGLADRVAFGGEAGDDAFRIDQRLGAAEADDADFGVRCPGVLLHAASYRAARRRRPAESPRQAVVATPCRPIGHSGPARGKSMPCRPIPPLSAPPCRNWPLRRGRHVCPVAYPGPMVAAGAVPWCRFQAWAFARRGARR